MSVTVCWSLSKLMLTITSLEGLESFPEARKLSFVGKDLLRDRRKQN